jgi:hypothetical protein
MLAEYGRDTQRRVRAVRELTAWLDGFPGATWQARWAASGADAGGLAWPGVTGHYRRGLLFRGAETLMILRVVHPTSRD